jgi:hypothetical protein
VSCVASNLKYLMIATGSVDNNIKLWECKWAWNFKNIYK